MHATRCSNRNAGSEGISAGLDWCLRLKQPVHNGDTPPILHPLIGVQPKRAALQIAQDRRVGDIVLAAEFACGDTLVVCHAGHVDLALSDHGTMIADGTPASRRILRIFCTFTLYLIGLRSIGAWRRCSSPP